MSQPSDTGYFLFSLDTELAWGHYDLDEIRSRLFSQDGSVERQKINRILNIFNRYKLTGTWAVVGHLWFDHCMECDICPILDWQGRFASADQIVGTNHPLWYGRDILEEVLDSAHPQEIAFHGYTHTPFDTETMSHHAAKIEISEGQRVAEMNGVNMTAMVFPRNRIGYLDLFREAGFTNYRGPEVWPRIYYTKLLGKFFRRFNHYISIFTAPQCYFPIIDDSGLVNLPASRWMFGLNSRIDNTLNISGLANLRVNSMIRGVRRAAEEKKTIHIWAHPFEFQTTADFDKLQRLAAAVAEEVEANRIRSVGMSQLASMIAL